MDSQSVVVIEGLSKSFGDVPAVVDLTLSVAPGEIVALLGPNGAGKTTAIRMLMGILEPSGGSARIAGRDCFRARAEVMRHVGYLPDDPVFYDYLRGSEILRFVGEMHGFPGHSIEKRYQPLLERFDLEEALDEFAVNYSKGMKKKLALVCALLHEPSVLILDEPTNGLDPFATRTLHEIVRERSAQGAAVFFSTHLLDQAERVCHRVGILHKGRLAALGPLAELRQSLAVGGSLEDIFFLVASDQGKEEAAAAEEAEAADAPPGDAG
ncbi:MAG: ABC transporter ATP-binding protein [Planctomycetes bacterium]|nr:ABC transporter ATP-binding protein [Planctomycetota bacterium]